MSPESIPENFCESTDGDQENMSEALYKAAQWVRGGATLNKTFLEELTEEHKLEFDCFKAMARALDTALRLEGMPESVRVREIIQGMLVSEDEDENEDEDEDEKTELEPIVEEKDNTEILQESLVEIGNIILAKKDKPLNLSDIKGIAIKNGISLEELKPKALQLNKQMLSIASKTPEIVEPIVQKILGLSIEENSGNDEENLESYEDKCQKAREELETIFMGKPKDVTSTLVRSYGLGDAFYDEIKNSLPEWGRKRSQTHIIRE